MDQAIQLVPLVCIQCSTPIPAEPDEVAWVCVQCGQGMALEPARGLTAIPVYYTSGIPADRAGKPYWVADGQVQLRREAYRSNRGSEQDSGDFWSSVRRFFVPAYSAETESLLQTAVGLLQNPPELHPGAAARFQPVVLAVEDIQPVAEFIVMAVEAGRKDALKTVEFTLKLSAPALWILP